jgi:hypothetical protein
MRHDPLYVVDGSGASFLIHVRQGWTLPPAWPSRIRVEPIANGVPRKLDVFGIPNFVSRDPDNGSVGRFEDPVDFRKSGG